MMRVHPASWARTGLTGCCVPARLAGYGQSAVPARLAGYGQGAVPARLDGLGPGAVPARPTGVSRTGRPGCIS